MKFWVDFDASVEVEAKNAEEAIRKFWEQLENKYRYTEVSGIEKKEDEK